MRSSRPCGVLVVCMLVVCVSAVPAGAAADGVVGPLESLRTPPDVELRTDAPAPQAPAAEEPAPRPGTTKSGPVRVVEGQDGGTAHPPEPVLPGPIFQKPTHAIGQPLAAPAAPAPTAANLPPIAIDDTYTVDEAQELHIPAATGLLSNDSDPDAGASLSVTNVTGVTHTLELTVNPDGSFTYIPIGTFAGTDTFSYQAVDEFGALSGGATVTVTVLSTSPPPNTFPPGAVGETYTYVSGSAHAVAAPGLLANDVDLDGHYPLTIDNETDVDHGLLTVSTNGEFSYKSDPYFVGDDSFTYQVKDSTNAISGTVTVTIHVVAPPGNQPPVTIDDTHTAVSGVLGTVAAPGVMGNDSEPDGDPMTVEVTVQPGYGTLVMNDLTGAYTYQSDPGYVGPDYFAYRLRDGYWLGSSAAVVFIDVIAPRIDPPPTGVNDPDPAGPSPGEPVRSDDQLLPDTGTAAPWWLALLGTVLIGAGTIASHRARPRAR